MYNGIILPENTDLSSDHLPIKTTLEILDREKQKHILDEPLQPMTKRAKVDWSTDDICRIQDSEKKKNQKTLPWWSRSTATAKNRKSFWYKIWLACGKPKFSHAYNCYIC